MGIIETITVMLVVLKLFGLISWSWWLVFTPLLAVWGLIIAVAILVVAAK